MGHMDGKRYYVQKQVKVAPSNKTMKKRNTRALECSWPIGALPKKMGKRPAMGAQGSPKRGCRRGRGGQLFGGEILVLLVCPGLFQISSLSNSHRYRVAEASGPWASRAGVRRATRSTPAVVRTTSTPVPVVHVLVPLACWNEIWKNA